MKNIVLLGFTFFFILMSSFAQVIKVSYETNYLTPTAVRWADALTVDPYMRDEIISFVSDIKVYYSLYIDIQTKQELWYLDSSKNLDDAFGPFESTSFLYTTDKRNFKGCFVDLQNSFYCMGNFKDFEWEVLDSTKDIAGMKVIKVKLKNDPFPKSVVWVYLDIPNRLGPHYYLNAPGLILESEGASRTLATKIATLSDPVEMREKLGRAKKIMEKGQKKIMTFKKFLTNKKVFYDGGMRTLLRHEHQKRMR